MSENAFQCIRRFTQLTQSRTWFTNRCSQCKRAIGRRVRILPGAPITLCSRCLYHVSRHADLVAEARSDSSSVFSDG
jgi:hypothetical protein